MIMARRVDIIVIKLRRNSRKTNTVVGSMIRIRCNVYDTSSWLKSRYEFDLWLGEGHSILEMILKYLWFYDGVIVIVSKGFDILIPSWCRNLACSTELLFKNLPFIFKSAIRLELIVCEWISSRTHQPNANCF